MKYIAFLYKDSEIGYTDEDSGYNIIVPDVAGVHSYGDNFIEAVDMGKEALGLILDEYSKLPHANSMEYFTPEKLKELGIPQTAIPQMIEYEQLAKKRITVNLHLEALQKIDEFMHKNGFKNRSAFLEDSALLRIYANKTKIQ